MSITIRDAKKEDVEIVAWTVLTALDMDTDEMEKFIKSVRRMIPFIHGETLLLLR